MTIGIGFHLVAGNDVARVAEELRNERWQVFVLTEPIRDKVPFLSRRSR